ncbi:MAG: hypothetical protein ACKOZU_04910 [Planctomycetaceae bacterium]
MKFRSFLIVACIVVVPLIAMFSHRIPAGTRAAVAAYLRDLVGPRPAPPNAVGAGAAGGASPTPAPSAPAPAPAGAPEQPPGERVERAAAVVSADGLPRVVPISATAPEPEAFGALRALGAVAIESRPLEGPGGHVARCRVPVDGTGELERVFQATGSDAAAAAENLLYEVAAWRRAAPGAGRATAPATMRF